MAIQTRFTCSQHENDFLIVSNNGESVILEGFFEGVEVLYNFDVTTSIKLSKTIRTNINKIKGI